MSYTIYHESFAEFLLDENEAEDFWCNPVEQHKLIVNHYLKVWGTLRRKLAGLQDATKRGADDGYGLRHMAFHLEGAGLIAELHLLLALENHARRSVWYEAQLAEGNVAGYMADARRAWKLAEKESESPEQARAETALGLQIRYALVTASIRSLSSNLPPALLSALYESGIWTLPTALAYALQMPDTRQQAQAIAAIAPHVPVTESPQLMAAICEIPDEISRAQALEEAGQYLLRAEGGQVLEAVAKLSSHQQRGWVLTALAPYLPERLLPEAAKIASQLPDHGSEYSKHHAFSALAIRRNELGFQQEACREARRIRHLHWRSMVWMKLVWNLPESRRAAAAQRIFRKARELYDPVYLEEEMAELAALSDYLSEDEHGEALRTARELALNTQNSKWKVKNLLRLIPHTPEGRQLDALREADKAFEEWDPRYSREEDRVGTAQELTITLARFAGTSATRQALSKMWPHVRMEALTSLLPFLSGSERDETLRELRQAASGFDTNLRPATRAKLTTYLPAEERKRVLRGILDEVWTIGDASERAETVAALAPAYARLGDLESSRQAAQAARDISDESSRDWTYLSLAKEYAAAGFLEESLKAARLIKDNKWRLMFALKSIIPNLTPAWMPAAIEQAQRLPPSGVMSDDRDEIFKALALRWLQLGDPAQALATARVQSSDRYSKLFKQVSLLPPSPSTELLLEVFGGVVRGTLMVAAEAAMALPDGERLREVEKIAENLRGLDKLGYQIEVFTKIVPYLTSSSKKRVLKRFRANVRKSGSLFVLEHTSKLLPLLPADEQADAFREAINIVRSYGKLEKWIHLEVWMQFVSSLPKPLLTQMFALAAEIRNDYDHDGFLSKLLPRLAELGEVKQALRIAINLRRHDWRGPALASLAKYLDSGQLKEALDAAQSVDDVKALVKALTGLIPLDESQLSQALLMTLNIKEDGMRSTALASLATKLKKASHRNLFGQALRGLAIRSRPKLLEDLRALVTAIEHLGGITALAETRRAVQDVGFLWP